MSDEHLSLRPFTRPASPPARPKAPDLAFAALALLTRLRDALRLSADLMIACRREEATAARRTRGEPKLFFFDQPRPAPAAKFPEPYLARVTPRMPAAARAWADLPHLLDDALTALPAAVGVRRIARTLDGLQEAARELAPVLPAAAEVAELLAVPDDQVVLAIHPAARAGVRVRLRGVAEVHQLHTFLADALTGDPARGLLPGRRPHPRVLSGYRDADPDPDHHQMTTRFQLFHPDGLNPNGTLPEGFAGSDHWVWGEDSPAVLPLEQGERLVLLGEPVYEAVWEARRKFPRLTAEVEVMEVLSRSEVEAWLTAHCPLWVRGTAGVRTAA